MARLTNTVERIQTDLDEGYAILDTGRGDEPICARVLLLLRCENYQSVARSLRKYHVRALNEIELAESCMRHDLSPQDYDGYSILGTVPFFTADERAFVRYFLV